MADQNNNPTLSEATEQAGSLSSAPQEVKPEDFRETPAYQEAESPSRPQREEPAPEQSEQQAETPILDSMREKGYDVNGYGSDEQFVSDTEARYAAAADAERNMDELRLGEEQRQYQQEQYLRQQQLQQPPQQKQQRRKEGAAPEFDPAWADLVEPDEHGRYTVRPEYMGSVDPQIAENVNKYVNWRQERSNQLIDNPVQTVLEAGLGRQIQEQINRTVSQALSSTNTRSQAEEFVSQNAQTLYVTNPATGEVAQNSRGQAILSPVGQALNDAHVMLRNQGMTEPTSRHRVATQMVQNHFTQQQLSLQAPGPPNPEQYKDAYVSQPFAEPTNPENGYMPNTPMQPQANALGANGLPEHNSLGSLATALAVHKGFLQPK